MAESTLEARGVSRVQAGLRERCGKLAAVARALGTSRAQIHRVLLRHGLDPAAYR